MIITDGKKKVKIRMMYWTGDGYTPDCSNDFFEAGGLPRDEETDAYLVDDVDYCIDQAKDWKNRTGDFYYDIDDGERCVFVEEV